jgi:hypothetical protein
MQIRFKDEEVSHDHVTQFKTHIQKTKNELHKILVVKTSESNCIK